MKWIAPPYWHSIFLALLLLGIAADIIFGLDSVLNVISTVLVISVAVIILSTSALALGALAWITMRDAIEGLRSDRRERRAWLWRVAAYIGIFGIIVDGVVGTWNVFQQHVLFSTAVEEIPLAGVPVWLLLASYPIKWLEQAALRQRS
ncbi:MAG: hypothetical protein KGO02_10540 [Alphaproteobacteria bacterium]|nr:hypothetical protein [Alphaproteobacteria bacterium]